MKVANLWSQLPPKQGKQYCRRVQIGWQERTSFLTFFYSHVQIFFRQFKTHFVLPIVHFQTAFYYDGEKKHVLSRSLLIIWWEKSQWLQPITLQGSWSQGKRLPEHEICVIIVNLCQSDIMYLWPYIFCVTMRTYVWIKLMFLMSVWHLIYLWTSIKILSNAVKMLSKFYENIMQMISKLCNRRI